MSFGIVFSPVRVFFPHLERDVMYTRRLLKIVWKIAVSHFHREREVIIQALNDTTFPLSSWFSVKGDIWYSQGLSNDYHYYCHICEHAVEKGVVVVAPTKDGHGWRRRRCTWSKNGSHTHTHTQDIRNMWTPEGQIKPLPGFFIPQEKGGVAYVWGWNEKKRKKPLRSV